MSRVLPILFNTDMVRAILGNRKAVTRRIIKDNVVGVLNSPYHKEHPEVPDKLLLRKLCNAPYDHGDILYVRESWAQTTDLFGEFKEYIYRADHAPATTTWRPSIHMPRDAARIWLKVTDVKVERLQSMTLDNFLEEGITLRPETFNDPDNAYMVARNKFIKIWNSTIPKGQQNLYNFEADPWVWVIEFERCGKPKEIEL